MLNKLKSLFWVVRAFTNKPYAITDYNKTTKNIKIIYTIIISVIILSFKGIHFYFHYKNHDLYLESTDAHNILNTLNDSDLICFIVDIIICLDWNNELKLALDYIRTYDHVAKFPKKTYHSELNYYRAAIIIVLLFRIAIVYLTYEISFSLFRSITSCLYFGLYLQIFDFCGLVLGLYQRFDHLNQLILSKDVIEMKIRAISEPWNLGLQDIWWLHWNLSKASEKINQIWSIQLLLWLGTFFFGMLFETYRLLSCNHSYLHKQRDAAVVILCFINILMIIVSCHLTTNQANKIVKKVLSPVSVIQNEINYQQRNDFAIAYFCTKKIRFTAANGFINIHLPLLTSMIGAMTSYLFILCKSPSH